MNNGSDIGEELKNSAKSAELGDMNLLKEFKKWKSKLNRERERGGSHPLILEELQFLFMKLYLEPDSYFSKHVGTLTHTLIHYILKSGISIMNE